MAIHVTIHKPTNFRRSYRSVLNRIGARVVREIVARTRSGRDADGRPFAPYSPSTGKTGPVTLTASRSGSMLDQLQVTRVTSREVEIGLTGGRAGEIAGYHQSGTRHMPQRAFLGITEAQADRAQREIVQAVGGRGRGRG